MTSVPWFRYGLRESRRQLRMADTREARACWHEAVGRALRMRAQKAGGQ